MTIATLLVSPMVAGVIGAAIATTTPAMASPASSGESAFCYSFARFGDTPSYRNMTAMHADVAGADGVTRTAYFRFQRDLLAGYPRPALRTTSAAVYTACTRNEP